MIPQANQTDITNHLYVMFGLIPNEGWINLRGLGEKGTEKEGKFMEDKFIDLSIGQQPQALIDEVTRNVERWTSNGIGSFIVPAILSDPRGTSKNVRSFRSVVVDLDNGDIEAKVGYLWNDIGEPTAIVCSGGEIDGVPKRHLWWTLAEQTEDVVELIKLRHELALKAGGDLQFGLGTDQNPVGRAHQPVRIAGSVHNKNGKAKPVTLSLTETIHDLGTLKAAVLRAPYAFGAAPAALELPAQAKAPREPIVFTEQVFEGGTDKNRWGQFNRVAGHYIRCARRGEISLEKAKELTEGWVLTQMLPPWPAEKIRAEFTGLLNKDTATHGPMLPAKEAKPTDLVLSDWEVHKWAPFGSTGVREFLVDKLIFNSLLQMLVAEGGAGKSYLLLDLALKVSAWSPGSGLTWLGHEVKDGGTVVYFTTEDDVNELKIRLGEIDKDNLRAVAGKKLIVVPLAQAGGAFPLVEYDPQTREARASRRWKPARDALMAIPDLRLFIVDTLNSVMHGDENAAVVANEFIREVNALAHPMNIPVVASHHVRKAGDEPIRNVEDMKEAVRGSSALISGFRAGIGIWACADQDRRLIAMDLPIKKKALWKAGVIKQNNPEYLEGELTLYRTPCGLLENVTALDPYASGNMNEHKAWLLLAIQEAASAGHPFSNATKNAGSGLYKRRHELPPIFSRTGPNELARIVEELLLSKQITSCAARGSKEKKWLDLPTGQFARDEAGAELESGAFTPPNWNLWRFDEELTICTTKPKHTHE
jgi:hypothetical protein